MLQAWLNVKIKSKKLQSYFILNENDDLLFW